MADCVDDARTRLIKSLQLVVVVTHVATTTLLVDVFIVGMPLSVSSRHRQLDF